MSRDVFQDVFFLSLASNLVSDFKGTQTSLQKALQDGLNITLARQAPEWRVVWGPVVWKKNPDQATTGPENSWYIAYHPNLQFEDGSVHPTYLASIGGTPPASVYVWRYQNFAVNSVANFNAWVTNGIQNPPDVVPAAHIVPGTPYIATGTANAVHLLLDTPAPKGAAGEGMTLLDFVANVVTSGDDKFITTGHSLGGALSPSLALALVSSGVVPPDSTLTYPTAGATPGNRAFSELFTATFPPRKYEGARSYQGWNLNLINTLDIVPQAWCTIKAFSPRQNLVNIPPIFGRPAPPGVPGITLFFAWVASKSGAVYFPLPSQPFSRPPPSDVPPKNLLEFLKFAGPEHIRAYFDEVGVSLEIPDKTRMLLFGLTEKTEDEKRFNHPVIAEIEWACENPEEAEKMIKKVEESEEGKAFLGGE